MAYFTVVSHFLITRAERSDSQVHSGADDQELRGTGVAKGSDDIITWHTEGAGSCLLRIIWHIG